MSRRGALNRRALLRGLGGVAIGLPFLEIMAPQRASAAVFPKRFIVFFSANGTVPSTWDPPSGGETDFTLGEILSPLEPHRDKIILLQGIDNEAGNHGPGDGHQQGMGCMLTGTELNEGDLFCLGECAPGMEEYVGWGGGISIDQAIGQELGKDTKFKTLEFGVQVQSSTVWSRMSYLDGDVPVPPEDDPAANFDRIFGELSADPFGVQKLKAQRKSVLDVVDGDFAALNAKLGAADKKKLDNHLNAVREIELSLDKPGGVLGGSCQIPSYDNPAEIYKNDNFPAVGKAQMDLLAMSLACDMTRVASIQWDTSVSGVQFSWLGIDRGHHDMSHDGLGNTDTSAKLTQINNWYSEQFAYLIGKLDAIKEGDGTLLDNTVVLWCNELGIGSDHTRRDLRWVLAGGGGGYFKTGRYLQYDGDSQSNLYVSIANAMGLPITTFGNPAYCTGPLAKLTG